MIKSSSGFTLLELLLVIAIISALAGLILTALNPSQRLNEATEVKALANAKDIQKALNAYPLTNNGQFPTALQNLFDAGHTRVDICVSGQTCNGLDLTSDLVSGGFLSAIPLHPTYATATDSGYDIIYGVTQGVKIVESPVFLLRDEFITTQVAPLPSSRTAEPGPGTLTSVQTDGQLSIINGILNFPSQTSSNWGDLGFHATGQIRQSGRTLINSYRFDSDGYSFPIAWSNNATISFGGFANIAHGVYLESSRNLSYAGNGINNIQSGISLDISTDYKMAVILRNIGAFGFIKGGNLSEWKLIYVQNTGNTSTLYPAFSNYSHVGRLDNLRVVDLPDPFNNDYGLASDSKLGNVSQNTTFIHEADFVMEWVQTTVQSSGDVMIFFRMLDSNNYLRLRLQNNGVLHLSETLSGVTQWSVSNAAGVMNGHRIVLIVEGSSIRVYSNNVLRMTYGSATNFVTETTGRVNSLGTGGEISDLVTWPRTLSGEAAKILDIASL